MTPAAVGAAAGIARSSVYQYFDSTSALLAAIIEDAFPPATAALRAAVKAMTSHALKWTPTSRLHSRSRRTPPTAPSTRSARTSTFRAHAANARRPAPEQYAPLLQALTTLGVADVSLTAQFVGGMLGAAARAVKPGRRPRRHAASATSRRFITAPYPTRAPTGASARNARTPTRLTGV